MKRYPKMKHSGIEWLGEIPEHWEVKRLKSWTLTKTGYAFNSNDYLEDGIPLIRISDIFSIGKVDIENSKKLPLVYLDFYKEFIVNLEDVLMAMTGATIGKCAIYNSKQPALLNQRVCSFHPSIGSKKYLWYILNSTYYQEYVNLIGFGGAQPNISDIDLINYNFVYPPLNEQISIANYLDEKTSRLDTLISNKESQIKNLEEIRKITINQAVTKGLNPKAKLKPSGIEWLGEIPEHWEVKRLKDVTYINRNNLDNYSESDYKISYLDISNVTENGIVGELQEIFFMDAPSRARRIIKRHDIVISTVRPYLRAIAYIDLNESNLIASTGFVVLSNKKIIHSRLLLYYIKSDVFIENINSKSVGASYPAVSSEIVACEKIPLPPLDEQIAIANYLDEKTSRMDTLISNLKDEIESLKEIRKITIQDAVTGKFKVS